ncbi:MAG TPA: glycosyltransferase family 2 protein [Bacteroidota bacterium]|jgi:GT2 family glycosyltransferase
MPDPQALSIIIVTYDAALFLPDCLDSISRRPPPFAFEIIVVDNASTDDSVARARLHAPGAVVVENASNTGYAAANNAGYRRATGEFILLLNPDTILHDGALESMVGFLRANPDAGAIGPRILNPDGSLQRTGVSAPSLWNQLAETFFLDRAFPRSRIFGRHRRLYEDPGSRHDVDCLQGSCLLVRRDAVGPFLLDEAYFLYFEETDLCARLREEGWRVVYVPDATVVHIGGSGSAHYDGVRVVSYHRSYLVYLGKHFGSSRQFLFRLLLIVRAFIRIVLLGAGGLAGRANRSESLDRCGGYIRTIPLLAGLTR